MAQDILELLFKVSTSNDGGLNKVDDAIKKIGTDSGLSGQALENLEGRVRQAFEEMTAAGLTFEQAVKRISETGNSLGKAVGGSAKEIVESLKDASNASNNFIQKQKALQQSASGIQEAIGSPLKTLGTVATNAAAALGPVGLGIIGIAAAATFGAKALFDLVDSQGRAAQATLNMANQLGISAGSMRQMEVEAKIVGLSFQSMMIASRNLSVALEDPTGAGRNAAKALADLGIATQNASGEVRGEGAVFEDAIHYLAGIESQSKRTEEATRLFGSRGSASLIALIARYKELKESAEQLGYGASDQLVNELAKGEESINKLSLAWDLFKAKLAERIQPIVVQIVRKVTDVVDGKRGLVEADSPQVRALRGIGDSPLNPSIDVLSARGSVRDAGGVAAADQVRRESLDRGSEITSDYQKRQSRTADGLTAALRENSEKLKLVNDQLARGGLGGAAALDLTSQAQKLENERASLEAQKKSLEQSQAELSRLREEGRYPGLQSPVEFQKLIAERQQSLDKVGPQNEGLVDEKYLPKINEAIRKFFLKIGENVQKEAERTVAEADRFDRNDSVTRDYQKQLKDRVELSEIQYAEAVKQLRIVDNSDREAARRQQQQSLQLAQITNPGIGEVGAIQLGTQARVQSAGAVRAEDLAQIKDLEDSINAQGTKSIDDEKQLAQLTTQRLQVEAEYRKEIDDAQMEAAIKLAEYQKQQLDSYRQQGKDLFSAITTRGGLQQYGRSQAQELFGGVFGNITAPLLQSIGRGLGTVGKATGFGDVFKGTQLDPARAENPQVRSLDLNRASLDVNTNAVNKLSAVYSGTSVGGQSGAVQTGSVGDAMTKIAGVGTGATSSGASDSATTPGGSVPNALSKFFSSTLGTWLAKAGGAALGIFEGTQQLHQGGASGIAGAIGSFAGAGAAVSPSGSLLQSVLSAVGLGAGLFKALLPSGADLRAAQIANQTAYNQYVAPPVINQSLNQAGMQTYTDKTGQVQASAYSTIAETQPYKYLSPIPQPIGSLNQNWVSAPGQIIEPYQAPAATPTYAQRPGITYITNVQMQPLDSNDVASFVNKNSGVFASAVQKEVQQGHPVGLALQSALVGT